MSLFTNPTLQITFFFIPAATYENRFFKSSYLCDGWRVFRFSNAIRQGYYSRLSHKKCPTSIHEMKLYSSSKIDIFTEGHSVTSLGDYELWAILVAGAYLCYYNYNYLLFVVSSSCWYKPKRHDATLTYVYQESKSMRCSSKPLSNKTCDFEDVHTHQCCTATRNDPWHWIIRLCSNVGYFVFLQKIRC